MAMQCSPCEKPGPFDIVRTPAVIADLAGTHQVFEHLHQRWRSFERVIAAVQQVQVQALDPQRRRLLRISAQRNRHPRTRILLIWHWIFSELGCHHDALSTTSQGFTQDALAQTLAVVIRCVEKCHAQINSRLDLPNSIRSPERDLGELNRHASPTRPCGPYLIPMG